MTAKGKQFEKMSQETKQEFDSTMSSEQISFEEALMACDTVRIKKLISCGFYINQILGDLPPLSLALSNGLFEVVEMLISSGADVCQLDASGKFCPMYYAIKSKCPQKIIRRLVLAGAHIDSIVEYNFRSTALHLAVYGNQKSVIKCLLSLSADVESKDANGMTALHVAVQANHPKIVKLLISKGANLNAECSDKFTPLMLAIHDNNYEMVALLISLGSDVNYEPDMPKYSFQKPLNYAVGLGHVEMVRLLLDHGADLKPTVKFNDSPLHAMAHSTELTDRPKSAVQDIIQLLLEHGGDLDCYNNLKQNPLQSAIIFKNTVVAKYLLRAGASVEKVTKNENTPLHLASALGDSFMVKLLLDRGADAYSKNIFGFSPYDLALKQEDAETVRAFWAQGQEFDDVRFESEKEMTVGILRLIDEQKKFFHAIEFSKYDAVIEAIKSGANPKAHSRFLKYPLHFSVSQSQEKIVQVLLESGVPVNIFDANGETAFHVACRCGNFTICCLLLAHGACYNSISRSGKIPYKIAEVNDHQGVMKLLKCIEYLFCSEFEIEEIFQEITNHLQSSSAMYGIDPRLPMRAFLHCVKRNGNTLLGDALSNGFWKRAQSIMAYRLKYISETE